MQILLKIFWSSQFWFIVRYWKSWMLSLYQRAILQLLFTKAVIFPWVDIFFIFILPNNLSMCWHYHYLYLFINVQSCNSFSSRPLSKWKPWRMLKSKWLGAMFSKKYEDDQRQLSIFLTASLMHVLVASIMIAMIGNKKSKKEEINERGIWSMNFSSFLTAREWKRFHEGDSQWLLIYALVPLYLLHPGHPSMGWHNLYSSGHGIEDQEEEEGVIFTFIHWSWV